jgi:hypothetical protein
MGEEGEGVKGKGKKSYVLVFTFSPYTFPFTQISNDCRIHFSGARLAVCGDGA